MKRYTATLLIKEKGSKNRVRLYSKQFSGRAVNELQDLFIQETIGDAAHRVREEMLEALAAEKRAMVEEKRGE